MEPMVRVLVGLFLLFALVSSCSGLLSDGEVVHAQPSPQGRYTAQVLEKEYGIGVDVRGKVTLVDHQLARRSQEIVRFSGPLAQSGLVMEWRNESHLVIHLDNVDVIKAGSDKPFGGEVRVSFVAGLDAFRELGLEHPLDTSRKTMP
ncbi:hypothetical protein KUW04_05135 [Halomonas denitrificans]|nr:hypothetical protein [Halomonas denitrificans]